MSTSVEGRWLVPESWLWCYAKDIAKVIGGGTPSTKDETNFSSKGIPWLTPADLSDYNGIYIKAGRRDISEKGFHESSARLLPKGTVLFTSRAPIGYCVIAENPITTNQGFKSLVLESSIDPEYIRHYLLNSKEYAESLASGSTFKELSGRKTEKLKFPLPPLNEQRRIVAKIEELTAHSKRARAALDEVPTLIKQFKQSVLAAAFRGDLTADWREKNPDVEPAEKLLERIRAERRKCWEQNLISKGKNPKKSKYKQPEQITDQERYELPLSWHWMTLSDVAWYVKDGPHYSPRYSDSGIPFITGGNVRPNGVDFDNVKYISPELHEELSGRCLPEYGDILYTKGGTTGIARVNTYHRKFNVWVHVAILKCVPSIERFYLQHALNSPWCYQQSQRFTHGVGNQDLGLTRMIKILIPLAPQAEQVEIIRRVEIYMKSIYRLQKDFEDCIQNIDLLDQSILAKAFQGELVSQDPNDEPAAVLLERIRAEREKLEAAKKKKRSARKKAK